MSHTFDYRAGLNQLALGSRVTQRELVQGAACTTIPIVYACIQRSLPIGLLRCYQAMTAQYPDNSGEQLPDLCSILMM